MFGEIADLPPISSHCQPPNSRPPMSESLAAAGASGFDAIGLSGAKALRKIPFRILRTTRISAGRVL
jgi:hypothetical protein